MNVLRLSKRLAATGVASALAAGALVAAGATTATAATASTDYTCQVPLIGAQTFPVTLTSLPLDLTDTLPAGVSFPAGALDALSSSGHAMEMTITAPAVVVTTLNNLGTLTGVTSPDLAVPFGASSVPVNNLALAGAPAPNPDGSAVFSLVGTNGAFSAPAAGVYDITLPAAFTFVASTTNATFPQVPVTCASAAPPVLKHMTVTKNASTTVAKPAVTPFHKGKAAKMKVTVSAPNHTPSGKVVIKQGTKTLGSGMLNSLGKVVINMGRKLTVGKHKVVVSYKGDGYTTTSRDALTFKVVR